MLFIILLFLIQACRCELGQFRIDEAECKESYEQCISAVYCWNNAIMCYRIDEIEKTDDRTWCLVDKRCRKILKGYKRNDKIGNYLAIIGIPLIVPCAFICSLMEQACNNRHRPN